MANEKKKVHRALRHTPNSLLVVSIKEGKGSSLSVKLRSELYEKHLFNLSIIFFDRYVCLQGARELYHFYHKNTG